MKNKLIEIEKDDDLFVIEHLSPNRSQHHPKFVKKSSKNRPNIVPKSSQRHPQIIPNHA